MQKTLMWSDSGPLDLDTVLLQLIGEGKRIITTVTTQSKVIDYGTSLIRPTHVIIVFEDPKVEVV